MTDYLAVQLSANVQPVEAAFEELSALLERSPELALQIGDRLVRLIETCPEALIDDLDVAATSAAGDLVLTAKPSSGLLVLVAACRAGNADLGAIENALRHLEISLVGRTPKVERVGEGGERRSRTLPGEAPYGEEA